MEEGVPVRVRHSDENVPRLKYIHANALVMILDHSLARYYHWGKLGKGYRRTLPTVLFLQLLVSFNLY